MSEWYSYVWLSTDGTPYYVGKGKAGRAFTSKGHCVNCPAARERILVFPQETEADAFESEKEIIALFGRRDTGTGCLLNRTDGGDAPPKLWGNKNRLGKKFDAESRRKMSQSAKKAVNCGRFQTGHSVAAEWVAKIKEAKANNEPGRALKGHPWSEARRQAYERRNQAV